MRGFERQHRNAAETVLRDLQDAAREQRAATRAPRIADMAAAKRPHRSLEGAHLKPGVVTLDDIVTEYTAALQDEIDLAEAS